MNIVISNSVGVDREGNYIVHSPSRWSFSMKNYDDVFTYYPWELAYASSLLKKKTDHRVRFLDPCLEKWNADETAARIMDERPDILLMEPSSRTFREDMHVARKVREKTGTRIIMAGQHASAFAGHLGPDVDHVLVGEYEQTMLDIALGRQTASSEGIYPNPRRTPMDLSTLPWPEDDDVSRLRYAIPGEPNCEYTEIQMYASRGCPFHCDYCASSNIYFGNWRARAVLDVVDEMESLTRKYPECEGFFFDEEQHNTNRAFVRGLCDEIRKRGLQRYKFDAMCAYFNLDRPMLEEMAASGYYKIRAGIETVSDKTAAAMGLGKKHDIRRLSEVMSDCRELGLHFYGTFLIGGWGSTREEDLKTGAFIEEAAATGLLHDLQMSIATPQPGTPFYQKAMDAKVLSSEDWHHFDGGRQSVLSYPDYPADEIARTYDDVLRHYDRGLYRRNNQSISRTMRNDLKDGNWAGRRVLILRSTRMWHVRAVTETFLSMGAEVSLLGQERMRPDLSGLPGLHRFYSYGDGHMHPDAMDPALIRQLQERKFDSVVVLYNNQTGRSYENVRKTASRITHGPISAVCCDGRFKPVR